MARYNSRSRRRRRPRYRRRGGNHIRLYMVLTIALCATIYLAIKWQGGRAADPNDVNIASGEIIATADFGQPNTPALVPAALLLQSGRLLLAQGHLCHI